MQKGYLESVKKQFQYYKLLGDKTIARLPDETLFRQYNDACNSIATIVKHLNGNMLSRWTSFLTADGEKEWRQRDGEFENDLRSREIVMELWNEGWECLFNTLNSLQEKDLSRTVHIRSEAHSVIHAINRQLAHYAYHIGQIVFLGKMICGNTWVSLSIPKRNSKTFNAVKCSKPTCNPNPMEGFSK